MHRRWDGWKRQDRFLVQQWINLAGNDGRPCDIRVHLHKDGTGQWRLGGMGVREAAAGKITSNVHSGGKVHEVIPYLSHRFGEEKASAMAQQCERLAFVGAEHLEQTKNERLNELGFDFGIDVEGRIWLIEVNIKPGRHTIRTLYGAAGAKRCLQAQIDYARYLLNQLPTPRAKNARSV